MFQFGSGDTGAGGAVGADDPNFNPFGGDGGDVADSDMPNPFAAAPGVEAVQDNPFAADVTGASKSHIRTLRGVDLCFSKWR